MRVGIIAANNIRYSPYIFYYTDILSGINASYELIYPDRNGIVEHFNGVSHTLNWNPKLPTIINYALYTNEAKKIIRQQKYDILIVLTSVNAAYLGLWLKKYYKGRYIVDIRDYTHENIPLYFHLESIAVRNSLLNVISSRRFTSFLPEAEYVVCHNTNQNDDEIQNHVFSKNIGAIRIGYVGALSYVDQSNKLMNLVANDNRFLLDFYGSSDDEPILQEYARQLSCDRIQFHGAYSAQEKGRIIQKLDILFNAYGNGIPLLDYALSNKLYDALIYRKPILTCPNTYMTEMAGPLAYSIELSEEKTLDALYEWYKGLDGKTIESYSAQKMILITKENAQTKQRIEEQILKLIKAKG